MRVRGASTYLQEFRLQMFAFVQVDQLEVQVDAEEFGGEQNGAARSAARRVIQVDGHFAESERNRGVD